MMTVGKILISFIICSMLATVLFAADPTGFRPKNEFGDPRFAIDAVDFRSEHEEVNTIEVYYKIFYNVLSYQKFDDGFKADYQVSIVIEGENDEQIEAVVNDGTVTLGTYAETRREDDFLVNMIATTCGPQDVKIRATLSDGEGNIIAEDEKELDRRNYWDKYPSISRIEFAKEIEPASKDSKFNKNDRRVIPGVSRLFGGESDSLLRFYCEVYPAQNSDRYMKLITTLYLRTKGRMYADTLELNDFDSTVRVFRQININDLHPGDYQVELALVGRRGKEYNKYTEDVELELTAESMIKNDYKTAVDMLKYLATSEELKKLKKAKSDEERQQAWTEFWAQRSLQGNSTLNPSRMEYFRRIRHSNRYFSLLNKDGWKTTRGMIYVRYGTPDDVDDHPFELGSKPYQIWLYYRINPARKFLFIDEWGDGNYELQPPYDGLSL